MNCQECIDTLYIKTFCNKKRQYFLQNINNDIKKILFDKNKKNIVLETKILDDIKHYYNEKIKLVEYIKIKNNEEVIFVGDIHGDINAMINAFSMFEKNSHIIFLGDIVDRGSNSLECIFLLFYFKILYPDRVHIIRGNHECNITSKIYGFYEEIKQKINDENKTISIYDNICGIFSHFPIICIIKNEINLYRICGVHGCIDKDTNLLSIENIEHSLKNSINECWNDPNIQNLKDEPSERGCGISVSKNTILRWMINNHVNCIFRSHAVVDKGYYLPFFDKTYMIHIFSQPNYCNLCQNKASIAIINNDFTKCEIYVYDDKY